MSFFGLSMAGSALAAYQEAENVASNNIANVNTPGASRQQAVLTDAPPIAGSPGYPANIIGGAFGDGVLLQLIQRVHADSYDTLYRNATSSQYYYQVQESQLSAAQALLAEPQGGINDAYTAFQQAIQQLQANPADPATEQGVIASASSLVSTISTTGNALQSQEAQVVNQASSLVTQFNTMLDQIAQLNGQIRASTAAGDNANTYEDQRDNLIDQLSQYMSVQTNLQPNGSALVTVNGQALVNDTVAYHIAAPIIGTNSSGVPTLKIGFANDPNPLNPSQIPLGQGQFAGLLDLYNNKLSVYATQLDSFTNALATEVDRITTSGYDQNGVPGTALLQPIVSTKAISATNIQVGISDPSQVVAALVSTSANPMMNAVNSSNQTVDTSTSLIGNNTLQVPAAAALNGTLTVTVDGVAQTFTYSTTSGAAQIDASSIDNFVRSFNALQNGVTASYDTSAQQVVFQRDPNNESLDLRTAPGYTPGPSFSIDDSNNPGATGTVGFSGMANSLLGVLGVAGLDGIANSQTTSSIVGGTTNQMTVANVSGFAVGQVLDIDAGTANWEQATITGINGNTLTFAANLANNHASNTEVYVDAAASVPVPVQPAVQNASNAFGTQDNSAAVAMSKMFLSNVGVPGINTTAATLNGGNTVTVNAGTTSNVVMTESVLPLQEFNEITTGQQLTVIGFNAPATYSQLNGVVTAINRTTQTITVAITNNTGANVTFNTSGVPGDYTALYATPTQTLGQYYGNVIAQVGLDGQTATTGTTTQTNIANSINQTRQGIDGINLDEETQNLIMYQTAYQAAAKTVTVLDSMLQSVLGMIQ